MIYVDTDRIAKTLFTSKTGGHPVIFKENHDSKDEGIFVATEINRLLHYGKTNLKYSDIAILIRSSAIALAVEQELVAQRVPYRVVSISLLLPSRVFIYLFLFQF